MSDSDRSQTRLLHVSDTHLGYTPYGSATRSQDFADAFSQALTLARERNVDAVVHTGDMTHEATPEGQLPRQIWNELESLSAAGIPFYFILGNHDLTADRTPQDWVEELTSSGYGTRLGRMPASVGQVALYGVDYHPPTWWEDPDLRFQTAPTSSTPILCLHQSIATVAPGDARVDLERVIETSDQPFDAFLLGHSHYTQSGMVDETPVFYAGAPERTTRAYRDESTELTEYVFDESIERLTHELDTRPFGTYTLIPETESGVGAVEECLTTVDVADKVATVFIPETHENLVDPVEDAVMEGGALDVSVHTTATALPVDSGVHEATPTDLRAGVTKMQEDLSPGLARDSGQATQKRDGSAPIDAKKEQEDTMTEFQPDDGTTADDVSILHHGAVYIGSANLSIDRREDFQRSLEQIVTAAISNDIDAVVGAGTFFGTASPPQKALDACTATLERLADAGIPYLHAGAERDRRTEAFSTLVEQGLINQLGTEPVLVGNVAVYGLPPFDTTYGPSSFRALDPVPSGADRVIVSGTVSVAPPLEQRDADCEFEQVEEAAPFDVDAYLLGGTDERMTVRLDRRDAASVLYPGPTERQLYQSTFDEQPDYPCSVSIYGSNSNQYEPIPLDFRPVHTYEFTLDAGAKLSDVTDTITDGLDGTTVMLRLHGTRSDGDVETNDVESWLDERAAIVKVYDKRADVESPTDASQPDVDDRNPTVTQSDADNETDPESAKEEPKSPHRTSSESSSEADVNSAQAPSDTTGASPPGSDVDSLDTVNDVTNGSGSDPLIEGVGGDITPESHLAGEDLIEAGYAEIRSTSGDECGYVFHAADLESETDQRCYIEGANRVHGSWYCPHKAPDGDRCPFHADPETVDEKTVQTRLLECLNGGDSSRARFIGATFKNVNVSYETITAADNSVIDFSHAHITGDVTFTDVTVGSELRFDGVRLDGTLSLRSSTFHEEVRIRNAFLANGVDSQWSVFDRVIIFKHSLLNAKGTFQNCTFESVTFSDATYADDLVLLKSRFREEVYLYSVDMQGQLDCRRAKFENELRFSKSSMQGGATFEDADFANTVLVEKMHTASELAFVDVTAAQRIRIEHSMIEGIDCTDIRTTDRFEVVGGSIGNVAAEDAVFGDDIRMQGVTVSTLSLAGSKVERDVWLASPHVTDLLNLRSAMIDGSLVVLEPEIDKGIDLGDAKIDGGVEIDGPVPYLHAQNIRASGRFRIDSDAEELGPLEMTGGTFDDEVVLTGSGMWKAIAAENATFGGTVNADVDIAGELSVRHAVFQDLTEIAGNISGRIDATRCKFMDVLRVVDGATLGDCTLTNAHLERGLTVDEATLESLQARGATFTGPVEATRSRIIGSLSLVDATVTDTLQLQSGRLGSLKTSEGVFQDAVDVGVDIDEELILSGANFEGRASFSGIEITGRAALEETQAVTLEFVDVDFGADLDASRATVERRASFTDAVVEGVATFVHTTFGEVRFDDAEFRSGAMFDNCRVRERADFTNARVADSLSISGATAATILLDGTKSISDERVTVDCQNAQFDSGRITQPKAGTTRYDLTDATIGPITIDLTNGSLDQYRFYRTTFDGFRFSDHEPMAAADWNIHEYEGAGSTTPRGLETTYRRAKNGAAQVGDSDAEGQFFIEEMLRRKDSHKATGDWKRRWLNEFYRRSSGYGEQPKTVITASIVGVGAFALLYPAAMIGARLLEGAPVEEVVSTLLSGGLLGPPYDGPFGWALLSAESFATIVHGGTVVTHPWVRALSAVEGFLGAFFIALFLFTLTKSIDR